MEPPGSLTDNMAYDFLFAKVEKNFESYNGVSVRVRYYVNVFVNRGNNKLTEEATLIVQNIAQDPLVNQPAIYEVGI